MYLIYLQRKAGGGGHPDPEISGGVNPVSKKIFFGPLGPSAGSATAKYISIFSSIDLITVLEAILTGRQ